MWASGCADPNGRSSIPHRMVHVTMILRERIAVE